MTYKASLIDMTLHKMNWNYLITQIILVIENYLKISTMKLKLSSASCYILRLTHHGPGTAHYEAVGQETAITFGGHIRVAHTLPTFEGDTSSWLHFRDIFEALIVNNKTLSNVQKFHYLIGSLKSEAKDLISNLQTTNENFLVAWQLVKQRYNNKRLIVMIHAKHLCQMP